jgi:hypothetical protein
VILFAAAAALGQDVSAAGYARIMTRPDFAGGNGRLGYWNLYGRLLNEGPYAALELQVEALEREAGSARPWTDLHLRIEGGSVGNADPGNGVLSLFRLSQLYAQAGNVTGASVVWRVGTLESSFGDLGLYDMQPARLLFDTVGGQATVRTDPVDVVIGAGDAGYAIKGSLYDTVLTAGATARIRLVPGHLEIGGGGQYYAEPKVVGNRLAPHQTPGLGYEDYIRGEFLEHYAEDNQAPPGDIPDPEPRSASSWHAVGYVGFGGVGPLRWNNLFLSLERLHPLGFTTETFEGVTADLYVHDLTDRRTVLLVGDELQARLIPDRLDIAVGGLLGRHTDLDNQIAPSDDDRGYGSVVGRSQIYLTPVLHWLGESSYAVEASTNGNRYRDHADSIFTGANGVQDARGLELGDDDRRVTWQGKTGFVLNPLGPGIYVRPSLRLLYGVQHSSENNAFGNSFVADLDQYNTFGNVERHWHQVVALEAETWF